MGWRIPRLGTQDQARVDELIKRRDAASGRDDAAGARSAQREIVKIRERAGQVDRES